MSKEERIEKIQYWLKFSLFFVILFFVWLAFEDFFANQFQKLDAILPKENNSLLIWIFRAICLLCLLYIAFRHYQQRVFSWYFFGILVFIILIYLRYRVFWSYNFWGLWEGKWEIKEEYYISAMIAGVILPALFLLFILWKKRKYIMNKFNSFWDKLKKKDEKERREVDLEIQSDFLSDEAKKTIRQDEYNFKPHVEKFVEKITNWMDTKEESHSFGLLGDWGSGKSTYANLIKEELNKKEEYIIVDFNPRHSKSLNHIQKDFFNLLEAALEDYDMAIPRNLNKYLHAIGVHSESRLILFFTDLFGIMIDEDEIKKQKEKVEKSIKQIDKKVVVFIDDFDRLLCDEILEVLKLIDANANFKNVIFISAYDKRQVEEVFSNAKIAGSHKFAEKFFNTEHDIPLPDKEYILEKFRNELLKRLPKNSDYGRWI